MKQLTITITMHEEGNLIDTTSSGDELFNQFDLVSMAASGIKALIGSVTMLDNEGGTTPILTKLLGILIQDQEELKHIASHYVRVDPK